VTIPATNGGSARLRGLLDALEHGQLFWFADWPVAAAPRSGAMVYTVWNRAGHFIYVGMAGWGETAVPAALRHSAAWPVTPAADVAVINLCVRLRPSPPGRLIAYGRSLHDPHLRARRRSLGCSDHRAHELNRDGCRPHAREVARGLTASLANVGYRQGSRHMGRTLWMPTRPCVAANHGPTCWANGRPGCRRPIS
jgi:hypothetical protein